VGARGCDAPGDPTHSLLRPGVSVSSKYEFIDGEKANYPITKMCLWLRISTSGFYEWRSRPDSATSQRRERLKLMIIKAFEDSDSTYGYRRLHAQLARWGQPCSPELVRSITRELGLTPCQPRPFRPATTIAGQPGATPDLLRRDFTAGAPGVKLVGDITYIRTWEGWLYLATVLDCCTKECVGYAMAEHMRTSLIVDALNMAVKNYPLADGAVFHSDRGTQYLSDEFVTCTGKLGLRRSVGRTGVCFDNAWAESFNAAVKVERVNRTVYPTREHARKDIARYIEIRYNTKRLHSALGYRTPKEARQEYYATNTAA
jgi:putative transposase